MKTSLLNIRIEETSGINRTREPVSQGIPFPQGAIFASAGLYGEDDTGQRIPIAGTPLARWRDGSIKWLLLDFQISVTAGSQQTLRLFLDSSGYSSGPDVFPALDVHERAENISVCTGATVFELDRNALRPFSRITMAEQPVSQPHASRIVLLDAEQREWFPRIERWTKERQNPLRTILTAEGTFFSGADRHVLRYICRLHFFAGKTTVRLDFTIWNPQAARHPGGIWDLGDTGSILFRDLTLEFSALKTERGNVYYALNPGDSPQHAQGDLLIYQDSSGGEHWQSHNHLNREEKIPVTFQGFEVREHNQVIAHGLRTTPWLAVARQETTITASIRHFWQNFPKALEAEQGTLRIRLFPHYFHDLFELQGGEQKTHTIYLDIMNGSPSHGVLDWIHTPLLPRVSPEAYSDFGVYPLPVPLDRVPADAAYSAYQEMIDRAIRGEDHFWSRREIIDEYGWRNFGDVYADHEAVFHTGKEEFVSHYNNQYDIIKGALIQFMRTGEADWFRLADEVARHVSDIDIYHTVQDRYEYNHGMFWHTDHHLDAATCTHRGVSRKHQESKDPRLVGAGPSYSHNYPTGLLYHYWLTGSPRSRESVLALGDNVFAGVEGSAILLERWLTWGKQAIKKIIRSDPESETVYEFNGPGRASGNALNTLLDAYILSSDERYLNCAEKLIRRCVARDDDIDARDLLNAEIRWMYNVFLQSLGKYLHVKHECAQLDQMFWYARTVLLRYAEWMLTHEYPYLKKPEILEFPNETWSAQELRKSDVLAYAAQYAPEPLRQQCFEKSRFFFEAGIRQLQDDFPHTNSLTRVIVLLMTNGMAHISSAVQPSYDESIASKPRDFSLAIQEQGALAMKPGRQFAKMKKKTSFRKEVQWLKRFWNNR